MEQLHQQLGGSPKRGPVIHPELILTGACENLHLNPTWHEPVGYGRVAQCHTGPWLETGHSHPSQSLQPLSLDIYPENGKCPNLSLDKALGLHFLRREL